MKFSAIIILLLVLLVGCNEKDNKKIAFLIPERGRFITESEYFEEKIKELGYDPMVVITGFDPVEQLDKGNKLVESKEIGLLIIAAVNGNTIAPLVRNAKYNGIPVIAYNMLINNVDYDAFVSGDNKYLAELFCRDALKAKPKGNYVVIGGDRFDRNGFELKQGIDSILAPYVQKGDINVVYNTFVEGWSTSIAQHEFEKVVNVYGDDLEVILSSNDDMAEGVRSVIEKYKFDKDFYITGQDASIKGLKNVLKERQTMTVYHPAKSYGYSVAELANSILQNENIEDVTQTKVNNGVAHIPTVLVKSKLITKRNLKKELIDTGILTLEEINK